MLKEAEVLKHDAFNLLDKFLKKGPFNPDWTAKQALAFLKDIRAQLKKLRGREAKLRADLGLFDLSLLDSPELLELEKELETLELVWTLTDEWDKAWESYRSGEFWKIETEEMEATAQTLFRKLTRLSRELKDKK